MTNPSSCSGNCRLRKKYRLLRKVGEGCYGCVYKAVNNESGEVVAIKVLKKKYSASMEECLNMREVKILRQMEHPNIIKLREVIKEDQVVLMVFDYMEENLHQIMKSKASISESEIRDRCFQILMGLHYMHESGHFHRDIKPGNILVTQEVTKIADFGFAREVTSNPPYTDYVTTRWYRAPEVILQTKNYGPAVDMWAVGVIMAEMFLLHPLFPGKTDVDQLYKIISIMGCPGDSSWCANNRDLVEEINIKFSACPKYQLSEFMPLTSEEAIDLMDKLLSWDPRRRPTALQALLHPFFGIMPSVSSMLPPPAFGYPVAEDPTKLQLAV